MTDEASTPSALGRAGSVRPFALGFGAAALASWLLLRGVTGGPPGPVEYVPGTPLPSTGAASGATPSVAAAPSGSASSGVVVQVLGEVRRPGLVTLPVGSRVADAVRAAGGLVPGGGTGGLNLARALVDGEQVVVAHDTVVATPAAAGGAQAAGSVVDLNTATAAELDSLPGVGPVTAGRIVDWRTAHGRFASVDQLREVSGIGPRTLDRLRPYVRV